MSDPILTVLIPAYNSASFIKGSLESISNQTFSNFIAYISIDKSEDETWEICNEHTKIDTRFHLRKQTERLGWIGNSNFLLNLINTRYAMFAFHDDILHLTYFSKLIEALELNHHAAIAYSDTLLTNQDGSREYWEYTELDGVTNPLSRAQIILNRRGKWWVPNRGIFRSSFAKKINGLKIHDSGEFSADLPWLFHLSLYGDIVRIPETLCYKFYKNNSLSRSWSYTKKEQYDVLASCMRELWHSEIDIKLKISISSGLLKFLHERYATTLTC